MAKEIIGPQSEFQRLCLSSDARIVIMGGAAGSAKSTMGLMRHLRFIHDPYYSGFCIRKNSTAIMKEGGLFSAAVDLYRKVDPKIKIKLKDQKIVFSSGATVSFSHYENDKAADLYQGLELSGIFYDEAAQASQSHIWWLISRLRTKAKMTPTIWLSMNPDPDSFLREWVSWWLYPEDHPQYGLPDPEKNGKIRYLLRKGGDLFWGDSAEELIERYGNPNLSVNDPKQVKPLSVQCLLGTIYDNPWLLENQPEYLASLEALPDMERRRLLMGDWEAREANSTYFQRNWCEELVGYDDEDIVKVVRAYDFAGSLRTDGNPSPDYTVGTLMGKTRSGNYIILDVKRTRIRYGDWEKFIIENAMEDKERFREVTVLVPEDPNPAAKAACSLLIKSLAENGFYAQRMRASSSKLDRFRPFSSLAQNGFVKFLKGCGTDLENKVYNDNNFIYKELEAFDGLRRRGENGHDDIADSISDATSFLASKTVLPNFLSSVQKFQSAIGEQKIVSL